MTQCQQSLKLKANTGKITVLQMQEKGCPVGRIHTWKSGKMSENDYNYNLF